MGWFGKLVGLALGQMVGGPLVAVVGAAVGHIFYDDAATPKRPNRSRQRESYSKQTVRTLFYTTTFSVMGHLCKADGRVSEAEIALARQVMVRLELSGEQRKNAMRLFNEGKRPGFPLELSLARFRQEMRNQRNLLRTFLEIQIAAAYSDGQINPPEQELLSTICENLGISRFEYEQIYAYARAEANYRREQPRQKAPQGTLTDAYATLKVDAKSGEAEIKRAYRRLMSQNHPDKLASKGLSDEKVRQATLRTHEIRQAYERIREARGF
jgi:DnaJ like chaperone protein